MNINRLGLGCMGMNLRRNPEMSILTIHAALDAGITFFNTGNFYQTGESEMLLGQALKGISRERFFVSVKFGVLFEPSGKLYGLDVHPHHIKAQLTYSLHRLGLDYVDLYQPSRMDSAIPVEDIIGVLAELKQEGYIRNIGMTEIDAETLRRAHKVAPIHTVELEYSLLDRSIEKEIIPAAEELGIKVLLFGVRGHGLLNDRTLEGKASGAIPSPALSPENLPKNLPLVRALKNFAETKGVSLSQLMTAWALSKYPDAMCLVGTTSPEHLQQNIDALKVELSYKDISEIEEIAASHKVYGNEMRSLTFTGGMPVYH
ncbi:MAG: aldo/keto reductase [Synergistaceae bacterium]|nr:aldo/keto reductase [Synergistaceae bacterium]